MPKLTIISATNRPGSRSLAVANNYAKVAKSIWSEVIVHSLEALNGMSIHEHMYDSAYQDAKIVEFQDSILLPNHHFLFVIPEYNGTYPGILKFLVDAASIRMKDETFKGKHLAMVGVASGRSGNLRGMDNLTNALNYLGMLTFQSKIPVSQIHTLLDEDGVIEHKTLELFKSHSQGYLDFCS